MDANTAEIIVKVYAVLAWLGAAGLLFGGLAMLLGGSIMGGMMVGVAELPLLGGMMGGLFVVFGIVFLALAALYVFVGINLWKKRSWARIAAIVLSVLGILSFPFGTIIGAFGIYFFAFDETAKKLFK